MPTAEVETKSVELADVKAGVQLNTGHPIVLVVNGATGSKRYAGAAGSAAAAAGKKPGAQPKPGAEGGVKDGKFHIEMKLKAKGGTPLAHERVRLHDPDTGKPVGEPAVTDEKGILRARVPAKKKYHVHIEHDPKEKHQLPPLGHHLGAHGKSSSRHSVLSVEFLDAKRAPVKGEKVKIKGPGGEFEATTDEHGCIH